MNNMDMTNFWPVGSLYEKNQEQLLSRNSSNGQMFDQSAADIVPVEILEKILKYGLVSQELLKCRLVSHKFDDVATKLLNDSKVFQIQFNYTAADGYPGGQDGRQSWKRKNKSVTKPLSEFSSLLDSIPSFKLFPCNRFRFHAGDFGSKDATQFFSTYGRFITHLELDFSDYSSKPTEVTRFLGKFFKMNSQYDSVTTPITTNTCIQLLGLILPKEWSREFENAPTLSKSCVFPQWGFNSESSSSSSPSKVENTEGLPILINLKTLKMNLHGTSWLTETILRDILLSSHNLQVFETYSPSFCFPPIYLKTFFQTNKMSAIKQYRYIPEPIMVEHHKLLAESQNLQLKSLVLSTWKLDNMKDLEAGFESAEAFKTLLKSTSNSLNELEIIGPLTFMSQGQDDEDDDYAMIKIDYKLDQLQLPQLKTLIINISKDEPVFPLGLQELFFDHVCPNLETFVIQIINVRWSILFPEFKPVRSVRRLVIKSYPSVPSVITQQWMYHLSITFPNVVSLETLNTWDFTNVSQYIWIYFRHLTSLRIEIPIGTYSRYMHFDSIFTGLKSGLCDAYSDKSDEELNNFLPFLKPTNNIRIKPSIVNLEKLESLEIKFYGDMNQHMSNDSTCPFLLSIVTKKLAFDLMDKLKNIWISVAGLKFNDECRKKKVLESMVLRSNLAYEG